ncbi:MAG: hypothetical protein V4709_10335 [Pseudomonadota bacterium]
MNFTLSISGFAGMALLALSVSGAASAQTPTPSASPLPSSATQRAKPVVKPVAKKRKAKSPKRLSKATLSAFEPLDGSAALKPASAGTSAAASALSPMVTGKMDESLRQQPVLESHSGLSLDLPVSGQAYFADEVSGTAKTEVFERNDTATVEGGDQLGAEPVSVIDRISDKPKGRPLANGPLRVKMKDSGVRASVQFPLSTQP